MKLKEYLKKYDISETQFAARIDVSSTMVWFYLNGKRSPSQKTAERIEKETDGLVTVIEMRGKDARIKRKTNVT